MEEPIVQQTTENLTLTPQPELTADQAREAITRKLAEVMTHVAVEPDKPQGLVLPVATVQDIVVVQMPSLGRIVHYVLSADDCARIIAARKAAGPWQQGNEPRPGAHVSMMIVAVWGPVCVNGHVLLDGNDGLWVTSVSEGTGERTWHWPERA